jgi:hypothetical protein
MMSRTRTSALAGKHTVRVVYASSGHAAHGSPSGECTAVRRGVPLDTARAAKGIAAFATSAAALTAGPAAA